ncbi:MAG: hypothetical protein LBD23_16765 [Oscillospiraceae bacterium]|jgi:hypothetical protein|nr:hypothetical protein [Oscillospiraceae bacterium]
MSGMFEPKADKASRKLARTQKEVKEKRKKRIITITVISVLLAFSALAIISNSNFIRRTLPVLEIDGVSFTTAEFEYFFNSEYMDYANFLSQFGGTMPDANRPLSRQIYDSSTGETWAELIVEMTFNKLTHLVTLYNAAQEAGFTLSAEQLADIDEEIEMIEFQAMINGFPSTDSFLQQMFGSSLNTRVYREIHTFITTASAYNDFIRDSFTYSSGELATFYNENNDDLDVFVYRQFTVLVEQPDEDDDADADAAWLEAINDAHFLALAIAEGIETEDEFLDAAFMYNSELYWDPDSTLRMTQGERLEFEVEDWLLDESRVIGDVTILEAEQGTHVMMFILRDDNSYRTAGMRQILISREQIDPEDFPLGVDDPDFLEAFEQAEIDLHVRAEQVESLFMAAGATEEALISLMEEHSDDTTEGGLYLDIAKFPYQSAHTWIMKVVPEIEEWLFDEDRAVGDIELIYTNNFGYHLIYFPGFGDPFFELIADDRMRTRDHNEWLNDLTPGEPQKRTAFIFVSI